MKYHGTCDYITYDVDVHDVECEKTLSPEEDEKRKIEKAGNHPSQIQLGEYIAGQAESQTKET
jgi:hypothetical protein